MANSAVTNSVLLADEAVAEESTTPRPHRTTSSSSRRTKRLAKQVPGTTDDRRVNRGGSVMWTILLVGLLFSLVDVFYMVWLVDRHDIVTETSGFSSPSATEPTAAARPVKATHSVIHRSVDKGDGKGPIFDIIRSAGINPDKLDQASIDALPTWDEVVALYGPEPVIYGLDSCASFQASTHRLGFVGAAGTFNSGTNLMAELLIANCHMQHRMNKFGAQNRGIRWQVPWGKHTPPGDEDFLKTHKTYKDADIPADQILPAVTIRDPLTWLISMCHHHYTARWERQDEPHCPNFALRHLQTSVRYAEFSQKHESILYLWNDYYNSYLNVSFPRVIVRIEDLIFHPEIVTKKVCECAGGSMKRDGTFTYILNSAKKGAEAHGTDRTGFVDAMIKYGSEKKRYESYKNSFDLAYIRDHLDPHLMTLMGYKQPDPSRAIK